MSNFTIFADSACDLAAGTANKYDLQIIPMKISFDRETILTDGSDITTDEFYNRLSGSSEMPKTYCPTIREYVDSFKKSLDQGLDVLCICLSSKLTRAYHNALKAREILLYTYKNSKILVLDSLLATGGEGVFVLNAAKLRGAGFGIDETYERLIEIRDSSVTIFTISSLDQLARGGRMSKATAALGKLLNINPIIYLENGALVSKDKAIGRKKATDMISRLLIKEIGQKTNDYDFNVFHSRCQKEALNAEHNLRANYGASSFVPIIEIGITIGTHTGASVVGVCCMKKALT